ncbi:Uncharacterised protein [Afipia felis]|uniref:Uncharacterized protein n=3 Tax=Afipia felis TaxID=1035 RepID=A0A380W5W9_AFIFE|nr:hypothetical protein HMPREF9697_00063 [Afipia felis ATCC 53690]SUU76245.1 Uncharacterised protein [Afipia felis]SUU84312.1 Uncharacterised protein [Afipia felis]
MMPGTPYFSPRLILTGAAMFGMLLALGVHILGQRFGLDLGDLWGTSNNSIIPATAAIAWWLIAAVAFVGGYITASLLYSAVSGHLPRRLQHALIAGGLLLLIAAGQAASGPSAVPTLHGFYNGIVALILGAAMAFAGAHFALARH